MADEQTTSPASDGLLSSTPPEPTPDEGGGAPEATAVTASGESSAPQTEEQKAAWRVGVPEKFLKGTPEETLSNLNKSYLELEKLQSVKGAEVPEAYEPPKTEDGQPLVDLEDGAFKATAQGARKLGLTQEQFAGVVRSYMDAAGVQIKQQQAAEMAELGVEARDRLTKVERFLSRFGQDNYKALVSVATTAASIRALEAIMGEMSTPAPLPGRTEPEEPEFTTVSQIRSHVRKVYPDDPMSADSLEKELIAKHLISSNSSLMDEDAMHRINIDV